MMDATRWAAVKRVLQDAFDRPSGERADFVRDACGSDLELRHEVESLLAAHARAGDFAETPAFGSGHLPPGERFGSYEIRGFLAAGGMGDVYRAHDTQLRREVALKILPGAFIADSERLARFEREARVLAALNHPHIAAIYGLAERDGLRALVLELVEGQSLAERIDGGPLPTAEALMIAQQIAEALEAAHNTGIIHRDLKPANVMVTPGGRVKVLDFGLAKAVEAGDESVLSESPTITNRATVPGVILGTPAYMSPEQARGQAVDKRADVWAFGCVLYEMLTGIRAFGGENVSDTVAAVLRADPDWTALPAEATFPLRTLLRGCLEKDPRRRIADISAALFVLRHQVTGAPIEGQGNAGHSVPRNLRRVALLTTSALALGAAVVGTGIWLLTRPTPFAVVRTTITTSASTALALSGVDRDIAITPDGSRVVYRGNSQLLVRALDQLEPAVLTGLGEPQGVFTSPDGRWIGFFDGVELLRKVPITGGPPVTVCPIEGVPLGATWGAGEIIFATNAPATGLQRVSAAGGEPTVLTKPDRERGEGDHALPEFLPGGKAVLFTVIPANGRLENAQVAVLDLQTGASKVLIHGGSDAHYVPTGQLVYAVAGTLFAVAFDLGRLEVAGTPVPVLEGVMTKGFSGAANVAVAANGALVYVPGRAGGGIGLTVVSVDRQGRASPLPGLPVDSYRDVRVSPDGARLAVATQDDVWTYDFARATLSRLTTEPALDNGPLWTPNGRRIIFRSRRAGYPELFWRPADGTASDERLLTRAKDLLDLQATGWSADGRYLLFAEVQPSHECAIGQIAIERPSDVNVLVRSASVCNWYAAVSPNGRWMAYESGVSGRPEIYVERYPELGNRQQISTDGGHLPLWSRDGREVFYSSLDSRQMLAAPVQSGTTFFGGRPQVLFETEMFSVLSGRPYDIAPDGRFFIIRSDSGEAGGGTASNLIVVQNWQEELKRLVPVD